MCVAGNINIFINLLRVIREVCYIYFFIILDRKNGKHMEVLGSFAPRTHTGIKELRLRFSRCKFWLGVGADMTRSVAVTLARAGLIPPPPPPYGRRARGLFDELALRREEIRKAKLIEAADFLASGQRVEYGLENVQFEDGEVQRQNKIHKIVR